MLCTVPGLSTSDSVDEVSGRGVGLDVVRRAVEEAGGRLHLETSSSGTRVDLILPPARVFTHGVVVRSDAHFFALASDQVSQLVAVRHDALRRTAGHAFLAMEGTNLPLVDLHDVLGLEPSRRTHRFVAVSTHTGHPFGVLVDEVLRPAELVVEPLHWSLGPWPGLTGTTSVQGGDVAWMVDLDALATSLRPTTWSPQPVQARHRILIVDDSATSRTLLRNILDNADFETSVAMNGEEAWSSLQERHFDVVVTDAEMPHLDGFALIERIRADPSFAHLPTVLITSLERQTDLARGADAGADAYIVKGRFDRQELLRTLQRLL